MGKVLLLVPNLGSVVGSASGSLPQVLMMQTADQRYLNHLPTVGQLRRSRDRTVMGQGSMLTLGKDTPDRRGVSARPSPDAQVIGLARVGGLQHRYEWRLAA